MKTPYFFDEFFASGFEESISPFLTKDSRSWGKNISLKTATLGACFLSAAFIASFLSIPISQLFLCLVFLLVGTPSLISALDDLKNLEINISVLMTMAAFLAILIDSAMEGALLLVLFSLSHAMEKSVEKKTRSALHQLNVIAPKFAMLLDSEGKIFEKSIREIQIGETILVKNGEIVPLDGMITKGESSLNLVHLTGESIPVPKKIGDAVPAGAKNLEAALWIQVNRTSSDSTLAKIMQLILSAQKAKPKIQDVLDRFGKHYATTIISLTFCFALILPFILSTSFFGIEGSIYRSLAFLIAASPCALIIATPTAYLSAISACARKGILLKGGSTLDALSQCSTIAFDKTGTLTTGNLKCTQFSAVSSGSISLDQALSIAYGLEYHVVHPIAQAISNLAKEKQIPPAEITSFKSIAGSGIEGVFNGYDVAIGQSSFIASKVSPAKQLEMEKFGSTHHQKASSLSWLKVGEEVFFFQFSDEIRTNTLPLLEKMEKHHRLRSVMLTGDHESSATAVGNLLGIKQIFANLRPEDKLAKVAELAKTGSLAMVGDGINDAPALARANVGISMGKIGSATAVDASDVVLLNDDLHLISWLFQKSYATKTIIKQNLSLALSVICFATIPALLGIVPLWAAVILHEGGTVLVGLNSLRLLK